MIQVAKVQNADRMMISIEATYDGLNVTFADGLVSSVPWSNIREVHSQSEVNSIEFHNPYEILIRTESGELAEIPWDFVRHFGDETYRERSEDITTEGQRKFGRRLRGLRVESSLSQQKLAELSGVGRVTIARLESASQSPRLETIQKLSTAMGFPIQALLIDDWRETGTD